MIDEQLQYLLKRLEHRASRYREMADRMIDECHKQGEKPENYYSFYGARNLGYYEGMSIALQDLHDDLYEEYFGEDK